MRPHPHIVIVKAVDMPDILHLKQYVSLIPKLDLNEEGLGTSSAP